MQSESKALPRGAGFLGAFRRLSSPRGFVPHAPVAMNRSGEAALAALLDADLVEAPSHSDELWKVDAFLSLLQARRVALLVGVDAAQAVVFGRAFRLVHAFEPDQARSAALEDVAALDRVALKVHRFGLSDEAEFFADERSAEIATVEFKVADQIGIAGRVDAVKVDVGGFENLVLRGMRDLMAEHRPAFWIKIAPGRGIETLADVRGLFPYQVAFYQPREDSASGYVLTECDDGFRQGDVFVVPPVVNARMGEDAGIDALKRSVKAFWNAASCGQALYLHGHSEGDFDAQAAERYRLEPYIADFARFADFAGKEVLEIGVGLGADHQRFAQAGAKLTGIDLTERAIEETASRFALKGLESDLRVADAERLPFADDAFDGVYAWGVIHHSPDTAGAAREILRVLRPGGRFAVMIYHRQSVVGYMLWLRYALLSGKPFTPLSAIYAEYLESPGTKAFSVAEGAALFAGARDIETSTVLTHGDLLESAAGQRHGGVLLSMARRIWPRALIRRLLPNRGLYLMITGRKPAKH